LLFDDENIEIIAMKGDKIFKTIITISEWKRFKKKSGWKYVAYQIGFSQYNLSDKTIYMRH